MITEDELEDLRQLRANLSGTISSPPLSVEFRKKCWLILPRLLRAYKDQRDLIQHLKDAAQAAYEAWAKRLEEKDATIAKMRECLEFYSKPIPMIDCDIPPFGYNYKAHQCLKEVGE